MTQVMMQQAAQDGPDGRTYRGAGRGDRTRARARQAAKRRTFPLINSQIIAVADTGDLDLVMSTVEAYLPQMNLVNLSTALHRLAKLTSTDPDAMAVLHQHPTLQGLIETVRAALERVGTGGAPPQCQALSNIAWSLATVQVVDAPVLSRTADLAAAHLAEFKPFELASLLWAFAKMGEMDKAARDCAGNLFPVAAAYVGERLDQFTFRCQVMLSWAFAASGQHDAALFRGLGTQMVPSVHTASVHELASVAWSFGRVGVRQDKLFSEVAQKAVPRLSDLKPQELVDMLCSFARNGFFHKGFLEGAAHAAQSADLTPHQLATALCAFSRLRPRHHVTRSALLALLPRCTLGSLVPEEASSLALATAKCFLGGGSEAAREVPEEAGQPDGAGGVALPEEAAAFFKAAAAAAAPRLPEHSGRALAALAVALLAAKAEGSGACAAGIAQEAAGRCGAFETPALLALLRTLPCAPPDAEGTLQLAVSALAAEAARRAEALPPCELQALRRVMSGLSVGRGGVAPPVGVSAADLAMGCQAIADAGGQGFATPPCDLDLCYELLEHPADAALRGACGGGAGGRGRGGAGASAGGGSRQFPAAPLAAGLVCSVKNTFLHIDGDGDGPAEQDFTGIKPLPEPLDIIPPEVSPEKLEAYRMDYQKFRAGSALGAKGELADSVA